MSEEHESVRGSLDERAPRGSNERRARRETPDWCEPVREAATEPGSGTVCADVGECESLRETVRASTSADVSVVPKACAYVTRDDGEQLLVFRGPTADRLQIPKGTIEPDESPRAGLRRELAEESGLSTAQSVRRLARDVWRRRAGRLYVRHFFHVSVSTDRDAWHHRVTGDGPEAGRRFAFEWRDRPLAEPLALGLDDHLDRLSPVTD